MKPTYLLFLVIVLFSFSCKKETKVEDKSNQYTIKILEASATPPANVSILFQVSDGYGNYITNIKDTNFIIKENYSEISRYEAERKIRPIKQKFVYVTILCLDLSGSILSSESLIPLKSASINFIDKVMPTLSDSNYGVFKMSILWFDGAQSIHQLIGLTENNELLKNAINSINSNISNDNSTNLYGAIVQCIDIASNYYDNYHLQGLINSTSLVFFTDGTDRANRVTYNAVISKINQNLSHISYYTIGLGGEIDVEKLTAIGRQSFAFAKNVSQLTETFSNIAQKINNQANSYYLLEYCSPKRSGNNTLQISVRGKSGFGEEIFSANGFTGGCNLK